MSCQILIVEEIIIIIMSNQLKIGHNIDVLATYTQT